jgi:glucose/mannose-6-phosphate isomerase
MPTPLPFDPDDMLGAVRGLPDQIETTWARVGGLALPTGYADPDNVVLVGMGGSAIGGDLAARAFGAGIRVPMQVVRDYDLPSWVGPRTLAIASSFSGNTEETLAAFASAGRRGARRVAVTSGGRLAEDARAAGVPRVPLPPGGQPRAVLGHSLTCVLAVLRAAGLIDDPTGVLAQGVTAMRTLNAISDLAAGTHPASELAALVADRIPVIYAPEDLAPVARRWKTQLNENGKTTASWDCLPELDHNAIAGYPQPAMLDRQIAVVILTGPGTTERMARRIDATAALVRARGVPCRIVSAPIGPRPVEALWLVQLGDLVSVHLAYRYGVDPTEVEAIHRFKRVLG